MSDFAAKRCAVCMCGEVCMATLFGSPSDRMRSKEKVCFDAFSQ